MSEYNRGFQHRRPVFLGPKENRSSAWGGKQPEVRQTWAFFGIPITEDSMKATRDAQDTKTGIVHHEQSPSPTPVREFAGVIPFTNKGAA